MSSVRRSQLSVRFFRNFLYVTFPIGLVEFRFAYETYHTRSLFFERHVRTLTYSILAYAHPRAMT